MSITEAPVSSVQEILFIISIFLNFRDDKCSSQEGAFISGLYLGGARWNPAQSCIEEQLKHKELDILPVIHVLVSGNVLYSI